MKTKTEATHTPLPWSVESHTDGMSGYVFDANHEMIFGDLDLPIAKFIVKAVNSHEALIAFINACLNCKSANELIDFVQNNAEEVIAKAEGR